MSIQCLSKHSNKLKRKAAMVNAHTHTVISTDLTSFPASMVSLSLLPNSEPEATMALSMSPVAR